MKKELVLAYLAGIIGADGSISIRYSSWKMRALGATPTYSEMVAIGQCDRQALDLLQELFGGYIRHEKRRAIGRRDMYYWMATDKRAVTVLRAILPYLRIKRRQADVALQLRALKDRGRIVNCVIDEIPRIVNSRWGPRPRRWWRLSPETAAEYDALLREIRGLNDSRFPDRVSVPIVSP